MSEQNALLDHDLEITRVNLYVVDNATGVGLVGIAEVTLNEVLILSSIKLYRDGNGEFYFRFPANLDCKKERLYSFMTSKECRDDLLAELVEQYHADEGKVQHNK